MNLIDLFIKRRKKVERLTRKLARPRRDFGFSMEMKNEQIRAMDRNAYESAIPYIRKCSKLEAEYEDLEDKYATLKAIVLAIDDERIKGAVE